MRVATKPGVLAVTLGLALAGCSSVTDVPDDPAIQDFVSVDDAKSAAHAFCEVYGLEVINSVIEEISPPATLSTYGCQYPQTKSIPSNFGATCIGNDPKGTVYNGGCYFPYDDPDA
jgi:hypothetical protein